MAPIPSYQKAGCPMCKRAPRGCCSRCGASFSTIPTPSAQISGYEAHSVDHQHFTMIDGAMAVEAVTDALCLECYRKDFAAVYPDQPLPV